MEVLRELGDHEVVEFCPFGDDEPQSCSPHLNLPVGGLSRTTHHHVPEYHTSTNKFVNPASLEGSFAASLAIFDVVEHDRHLYSQNPKFEPQLGKRDSTRRSAGSPTLGTMK